MVLQNRLKLTTIVGIPITEAINVKLGIKFVGDIIKLY